MSPDLKVLVFAVQGGEIVPGHVGLSVEKCLKNTVEIILSKKSTSVKQSLKLGLGLSHYQCVLYRRSTRVSHLWAKGMRSD